MSQGRHPSTAHMLKMLEPNPNLKDGLAKSIADDLYTVAVDISANLKDSPELTAGLRHLLEAKDCFVRSAVFFKADDPVFYTDR